MAATTVPLWVAVVIAVGSPMLAFAGVLLAQLLTRRSARETETRWQREETMRILRWATDLSVDVDRRRAEVGLTALDALGHSPLLQNPGQSLLTAVVRAAYRGAQGRYDAEEGRSP